MKQRMDRIILWGMSRGDSGLLRFWHICTKENFATIHVRWSDCSSQQWLYKVPTGSADLGPHCLILSLSPGSAPALLTLLAQGFPWPAPGLLQAPTGSIPTLLDVVNPSLPHIPALSPALMFSPTLITNWHNVHLLCVSLLKLSTEWAEIIFSSPVYPSSAWNSAEHTAGAQKNLRKQKQI